MSTGISFIICPDLSVVMVNLCISTALTISSLKGTMLTMPVTKICSGFGIYSLFSFRISGSPSLRMSNCLCTGTL